MNPCGLCAIHQRLFADSDDDARAAQVLNSQGWQILDLIGGRYQASVALTGSKVLRHLQPHVVHYRRHVTLVAARRSLELNGSGSISAEVHSRNNNSSARTARADNRLRSRPASGAYASPHARAAADCPSPRRHCAMRGKVGFSLGHLCMVYQFGQRLVM
jgi:hypothetical protein